MTHAQKLGSSILLGMALFSPVLFTGCAVHASYRTYDPAYGDYHVWDDGERGYYTRWEVETHREHRDFRKRNAEDQKQYWAWRHNDKH
jgi:hypothetical protein